MGRLSSDLRNMGFEKTERASPLDDNGMLWSNGYETVCDETGIVIGSGEREESSERRVYKYRNSERIKMPGGHVSSYDWGTDEDDRFRY